MNQKVLSGLTATLFLTTLGLPLVSSANAAEAVDQVAEANSSQPPTPSATPATQADVPTKVNTQPSHAVVDTAKATASNQTGTPDLKLTHSVIKLGEQQSQAPTANAEREAIAKVQAHVLGGRKAATLYVRNIPILTLTGSGQTASAVKMGSRLSGAASANNAIAAAKSLNNTTSSADASTAPSTDSASQSDPVLRAAAIAAKINQLNREGVDAKTITVSWNAQSRKTSAAGERYAIRANKTLIAVIDAGTLLADSTRNLEKDALQATNRLRRLLGNAAPLSGVSGKPNRWARIAVGSMRFSGLASWYGPGFHGNPSASGEPFNQNAMTAAHRSLPFGTQVLVTNMDNGQSVVVRINDRGPYSGGRVIDLSTAAARVLGLIQSGVAPVRLDVVTNELRAVTTAGN